MHHDPSRQPRKNRCAQNACHSLVIISFIKQRRERKSSTYETKRILQFVVRIVIIFISLHMSSHLVGVQQGTARLDALAVYFFQASRKGLVSNANLGRRLLAVGLVASSTRRWSHIHGICLQSSLFLKAFNGDTNDLSGWNADDWIVKATAILSSLTAVAAVQVLTVWCQALLNNDCLVSCAHRRTWLTTNTRHTNNKQASAIKPMTRSTCMQVSKAHMSCSENRNPYHL